MGWRSVGGLGRAGEELVEDSLLIAVFADQSCGLEHCPRLVGVVGTRGEEQLSVVEANLHAQRDGHGVGALPSPGKVRSGRTRLSHCESGARPPEQCVDPLGGARRCLVDCTIHPVTDGGEGQLQLSGFLLLTCAS